MLVPSAWTIRMLARQPSNDRDRLMRLLDQIAQARMPLEIVDDEGVLGFAAARDHAAALSASPIRFVMDEQAAGRCHALLETDKGMLAADNGFMRVPAPSFWLEWPCPPSPGAGARTGLLVVADEGGRAGSISMFWEQEVGEPVPAQATVEFDLDGECASRASRGEGFALAPGLHPLSPNLLFRIDDAWLSYLRRSAGGSALASIRSIAASMMPGIEFLFVFSALLSERSDFDQREVSHEPLNRQRARRGKPALLDHVEVRLDLAARARRVERHSIGARETARLHHVRGHLVRRDGALFWRRSHLRGDATAPVRSRTVAVTSTVRHPEWRHQ